MTFRASFKPRLIALATACALTIGTVQPAHALFGIGDIVLDPSNLVQNTMTAARTLEQINNQIKQLQNEAQMLINQARNLASLPFNVVNRLRSNLETTKQLIAQARGLAYDLSRMDAEFARLYPEQYAATDVAYDRALVRFLIDAFLLRKPGVRFPMPQDAAGAPDGVVQHALVGRAYPERGSGDR